MCSSPPRLKQRSPNICSLWPPPISTLPPSRSMGWRYFPSASFSKKKGLRSPATWRSSTSEPQRLPSVSCMKAAPCCCGPCCGEAIISPMHLLYAMPAASPKLSGENGPWPYRKSRPGLNRSLKSYAYPSIPMKAQPISGSLIVGYRAAALN